MILVKLENIYPNPFQTRLRIDEESIQEMAASLEKLITEMPETKGLLQVPVARRKDGVLEEYELAFGHTRLDAFRYLLTQGDERFERMPLSVRSLSDEQMSEMAIRENKERRDLSAVEEAKAMQRHMAIFEKTQEEIAGLFGYQTQGTIANKLRLLALPEAIQEAVVTRELSERQARALLPIARWEDECRDVAAQAVHQSLSSDGIFTRAISRMNQKTRILGPWPVEWPGAWHGLDVPPCAGCGHYIKTEKRGRCAELAAECVEKKRSLWMLQRLRQEEEHLGIKALTEDEKAFFPNTDYNATYANRLSALVQEKNDIVRIAWYDGEYYNPHMPIREGEKNIVYCVVDKAEFFRPLEEDENEEKAERTARTRRVNAAIREMIAAAVPAFERALGQIHPWAAEQCVKSIQKSLYRGSRDMISWACKQEFDQKTLLIWVLICMRVVNYDPNVAAFKRAIFEVAEGLGMARAKIELPEFDLDGNRMEEE